MFFLQVKYQKSGCINEKTAIAGGFFRNFGSLLLLVRLPLLDRRGAGVAKVKIKVKVREVHC
jgi:hypothetical protein